MIYDQAVLMKWETCYVYIIRSVFLVPIRPVPLILMIFLPHQINILTSLMFIVISGIFREYHWLLFKI